MHANVRVGVYLMLFRNNRKELLLLLRQNTGYADGTWSMVAGHVEHGEAATSALIREAYEEAGITIVPSDLKVLYILYRRDACLNQGAFEVFIGCERWMGEIRNKEPHKCGGLKFFPCHSLPSQMPKHLCKVITAVYRQEGYYGEYGF
ncbi:MAG: hypothetical protein RLZ12_1060 [Bacillota bacterium]|jgi:8-oxo-dGTP pyrophosphatase MutT (NUDIX family)